MNRSTVVYIFMVLLCAAGLWLIVRAGSNLRTTPNLAGTWDIVPGDAAATGRDGPAAAPPPGPLGESLSIEQSGRYVKVHFASGLTLDMKAQEPAPPEPDGVTKVHLREKDRKLAVRFEGPERDTALFLLTGPQRQAFTARRRLPGETGPAHRAKAQSPGAAPEGAAATADAKPHAP